MERRWIWIFFSIGSFASISTLKSLLRAIILRKKNARTWKLSFFRRFSSPLRARSFRTLIGKMSLSLSLDAVSRFFPRRQHRTCKVEGYRMTSAHAVATLLLHCISSSSFAEKDDDIHSPPSLLFFRGWNGEKDRAENFQFPSPRLFSTRSSFFLPFFSRLPKKVLLHPPKYYLSSNESTRFLNERGSILNFARERRFGWMWK